MSKWKEVESKKVLMSTNAVATITLKNNVIEKIELKIGDEKIIINKKILDVLDDSLDELLTELYSQGLDWG